MCAGTRAKPAPSQMMELQAPQRWDLGVANQPEASPVTDGFTLTDWERFGDGRPSEERQSRRPDSQHTSLLDMPGLSKASSSLRQGAQLGHDPPGAGAWEMKDYTEQQSTDFDVENVKRARSLQSMPSMDAPQAPRRPRAQREVIEEEEPASPARVHAGGAPTHSASAPAVHPGPAADAEPIPAAVKAKSRRASFIDFFRSKPVELDPPEASVTRSARSSVELQQQPVVVVGQKSRRASFIDLFRSSQPIPGSPAVSTASGASTKPRRRASILDLFGGNSGAVRRSSSEKAPKSRRASVMDLFSFGGAHNEEDEGQDDVRIWYTSLDEFRPLNQRFHTGKFMESYYAKSIKTGQHLVVKKYIKADMKAEDIVSVQSLVGFSQWLEHESIVRITGSWETDKAIFIVEEFAALGDLMQESMSHPDRYTEQFMAVSVVQPLLGALAYLHDQKITHRSICPEHLFLARGRKLKLGHLTDAVHFGIQDMCERLGLLDYMAPEVLAVKLQQKSGGRWPGITAAESKAESAILMPYNIWEMQSTYNEKADIWQVGCMVHELLCGGLPFQTEDKQLAAALILWADVTYWPESISPECAAFIAACLTKDPRLRPSAKQLLEHPWIVRTCAGEVLLSARALKEAQMPVAALAARGWRDVLFSIWDGIINVFSEPPEPSAPAQPSVGGPAGGHPTGGGAPPPTNKESRT